LTEQNLIEYKRRAAKLVAGRLPIEEMDSDELVDLIDMILYRFPQFVVVDGNREAVMRVVRELRGRIDKSA
jgi:hypothetical protein